MYVSTADAATAKVSTKSTGLGGTTAGITDSGGFAFTKTGATYGTVWFGFFTGFTLTGAESAPSAWSSAASGGAPGSVTPSGSDG
jgi:hypothetical protein